MTVNPWREIDVAHLERPDWEREWWVYPGDDGDWRVMQVVDGDVAWWEERFDSMAAAMEFVDRVIAEWEAAE